MRIRLVASDHGHRVNRIWKEGAIPVRVAKVEIEHRLVEECLLYLTEHSDW